MPQTLVRHDEGWDFRAADTKQFTHCFHAYPARMVPQLARELLKLYGRPRGWLLDPYCGSGTSLVEATLFGMNAVGCDINPLARLIARAKTSVLSLQTLDLYLKDLSDRLSEHEAGGVAPRAEPPEFPNRDYWFSPEVAGKLAFLNRHIDSIEDEAVRDFFKVAFAETARECSYTRNGEFKLFRMGAAQMAKFSPDVFGILGGKLKRNRRGIAEYLAKRHAVSAIVDSANLAEGEHLAGRPLQGFDLVLTSPPYGDSGTTVAYGQFSRLASEWLGLPEARSVDRRAMGGRVRAEERDLGPVAEPLARIKAADGKRGRQVAAFYDDLARSMEALVPLLARRAVVCYIVGNRRVKGVTLPTADFITHAFTRQGFRHVETITRNIPNKRMPSKNSPSNVTGATDVTMTREHIVICRR